MEKTFELGSTASCYPQESKNKESLSLPRRVLGITPNTAEASGDSAVKGKPLLLKARLIEGQLPSGISKIQGLDSAGDSQEGDPAHLGSDSLVKKCPIGPIG